MKTSDFDYSLPSHFIAQTPVEPRDHSKLMVVSRTNGSIEHRYFYNIIDYLREGDVLVFNESRVIPARLLGQKAASHGKVEILLLHRLADSIWETMVRPGRRVSKGTVIELGTGTNTATTAEVVERKDGGIRTIRFSDEKALVKLGTVPLPPYIHTPVADPERYQTVYAKVAGSVAAPTAGLHFTPSLIDSIHQKGIILKFVTLHVGLDSFRPIKVDDPALHRMHSEYGELSPEVAEELNKAREEKRRIVCVGTTTARLLEAAAQKSQDITRIAAYKGWIDLLILPGHRFRMIDALITNFHLPQSTLLMMVSSFAGTENILHAYEEAIKNQYRFYSFGDAMLIL